MEDRQDAGGRWRWGKALALAAVVAGAALAGAERAAKQRVGTDFHVFWQAGYDFAHGLPLYDPLPGARRLNYPPFAAQVFQVFGVLPMELAAWLFYVASVVLIFVAIRLVIRLTHRGPRAPPSFAPLALALLCSAVFIIDNLDHVQVNLLLLVLCLLGIQALVEGRQGAAGAWLVTATAIKITPALFVIWAIIRGGRRTLASVAGFGALSLALPVVQRGWTQGLRDLSAYHDGFLSKFAAGHVITDERNQNLAAMIYRAVVPPTSGPLQPYDSAYLTSLAAAAPLIYRALAVAILAALLIHLVRLRVLRRPVSPLEIASVFLAAHLLSGITWKAHLVTFLFVAYAFFSLEWRRMSRAGRVALAVAWAGMVLIGLGRDIIGSDGHHALARYSAYVWVMLFLFVLSVAWSGKESVTLRHPLFSRPSDRTGPCWTSGRG